MQISKIFQPKAIPSKIGFKKTIKNVQQQTIQNVAQNSIPLAINFKANYLPNNNDKFSELVLEETKNLDDKSRNEYLFQQNVVDRLWETPNGAETLSKVVSDFKSKENIDDWNKNILNFHHSNMYKLASFKEENETSASEKQESIKKENKSYNSYLKTMIRSTKGCKSLGSILPNLNFGVKYELRDEIVNDYSIRDKLCESKEGSNLLGNLISLYSDTKQDKINKDIYETLMHNIAYAAHRTIGIGYAITKRDNFLSGIEDKNKKENLVFQTKIELGI